MERFKVSRLSVHVRVFIGGIVVVTAISALSWFGWQQDEDTARQVQVLQQGSVDPTSTLIQSRTLFTRAEQVFMDALNEPNVNRRTQMIAAALSAYDDGMRHWRQFLTAPATHDGEQEVRDSIDQRLRQVRDMAESVSVRSLSNPDRPEIDLGTIVAQQALYNDIRASFDDIETMYQSTVTAQTQSLLDVTDATVTRNKVIGWALMAVGVAATLFATQRAAVRERAIRAAETERDRVARRNALDANLQNALDMADTEPYVYAIAATALEEQVPDVPASLLIRGGDTDPELRSVVSRFPNQDRGCLVEDAEKCPAVRRSQTMVFRNPGLLHSCRYLSEHPYGPCSAQCVPVIGGGNPIGVLHTTGPVDTMLSDEADVAVRLIARKVGDRVGIIRAFTATRLEASTDPLTGLANRRALTATTRALDRDSAVYTVAFGDLDRFKALNDDYGHDIGDQALRLFARALRTHIRPSDFAARYGGEEFVVVFPGCDTKSAVPILERVRVALRDALARPEVGVPPFTVSFGVAATAPGRLFEDVVTVADGLLLQAKTNGRDRIEVEQPSTVSTAAPPAGTPERRTGGGAVESTSTGPVPRNRS